MSAFIKNNLIKLRNFFGIKPVFINTSHIPKGSSVSDLFIWRKDQHFDTCFRFTDLLDFLSSKGGTFIKLIILNDSGEKIFEKKIEFNEKLNEIIFSNLIPSFQGYGSFLIFHYYQNNEKFENIIRNSCYTGISYKKNLPSFVHGNVPCSYEYNKKININIIGTSYLNNSKYFLQDNFKNFDKVELFFSNPTEQLIKLKIDNDEFVLKKKQSLIYDVIKKDKIEIISNCYYLRPYIFKYRGDFIDIHHG